MTRVCVFILQNIHFSQLLTAPPRFKQQQKNQPPFHNRSVVIKIITNKNTHSNGLNIKYWNIFFFLQRKYSCDMKSFKFTVKRIRKDWEKKDEIVKDYGIANRRMKSCLEWQRLISVGLDLFRLKCTFTIVKIHSHIHQNRLVIENVQIFYVISW